MTAASLTKSAFATMVMQLAQEGVVELDKPVFEYLPRPLPEYPAYRDLADDARYKQITMRMLLDHTSGFPNWRRFMDVKKPRIYFPPGSKFAYSGEGIDLAQIVEETITQSSANDLMNQRILQPLSMSRTSMVWEKSFENDYTNAYDEEGKSLGPKTLTNGRCGGFHADDRAGLRSLRASSAWWGPARQKGSRDDAKPADSDFVKARISYAVLGNDNRE